MRVLDVLSACIAIFCLALPGAGRTAPAPVVPEPVEIPTFVGPLHGFLLKPAGNGPFPAVIALHGCGGLLTKDATIQPRYLDWAEHLVKGGRAVLLPDSFGSRGLGPQCRVRERRAIARQRIIDIKASRRWLAEQPWIQHSHISLLGWASGANALLWAVRPQLAARRFDSDFRSAVAFYPDCRLSARLGWSTRVPTLVLIGGNDDLSSPAACRQMIENARGRSALARIVVYPGAYHDFDRPNLPLRSVAANDVAVPERGHIGTDSAARADSQRRVAEWLSR